MLINNGGGLERFTKLWQVNRRFYSSFCLCFQAQNSFKNGSTTEMYTKVYQGQVFTRQRSLQRGGKTKGSDVGAPLQIPLVDCRYAGRRLSNNTIMVAKTNTPIIRKITSAELDCAELLEPVSGITKLPVCPPMSTEYLPG